MEYNISEIKNGVRLHKINTNKFKTNLVSVFLTTKLTREDITKKALILAVLRRGTQNLKTQEAINTKLEELYGAEFDCGIDKIGDNHVLKFYIESLNDNFLYKKENLLKESINLLFDVIFNPLVENNEFKREYVDGEKKNIKQIIEAKKDNKATYALERCLEEMHKGEPYGIYKYGYVEDIEKITSKDLYETYKKIISNCKIDIFVSGDFNVEKSSNEENENKEKVEEIIENNISLYDIKARTPDYTMEGTETPKDRQEREIKESMDVAQGKLVIGMNVTNVTKNDRLTISVYNAVLGGGANSKLFQNVREKASLAYTAGSSYIKTKNNIIIRSGIEHENYEKALEIIKQQVQDMKDGNFTDKNIQDAKELLISSYMSMQDEQDSEISYYFGKEIERENADIEQAIETVKNVSKQDIENIAKKVQIDTIYFLTK